MTTPRVTHDDLRLWQQRLGLSDAAAAAELGLTVHTFRQYRSPRRRARSPYVPGPVAQLMVWIEMSRSMPPPISVEG